MRVALPCPRLAQPAAGGGRLEAAGDWSVGWRAGQLGGRMGGPARGRVAICLFSPTVSLVQPSKFLATATKIMLCHVLIRPPRAAPPPLSLSAGEGGGHRRLKWHCGMLQPP